MILMLPNRIEKSNIFDFIIFLGRFNHFNPVTINFDNLQYFELIPMTALLGKVYEWTQSGKLVFVRFNENSEASSYMQKMDFFNHCGIKLQKNLIDKSPETFVKFNRIGSGGSTDSGKIANEIASCLAPEQANETDPDKTNFFDSIEYCVSELMLNVVQHSRGVGFIGAQSYPEKNITQIAITDCGIGVRDSFIQNYSPHTRRMKDDLEALSIALQAGVSSQSHISSPWGGGCENAGVGLTILRYIAIASGGGFNLVSGCGAIINDKKFSLNSDCRFAGTYASFSFINSNLCNFSDYLEKAKIDLNTSSESLDWGEDVDDWLK